MNQNHALWALLIMGVITFALRGLPFVAARWLQSHPMIERMGRFLPLAIMTLLLAHAIRGGSQLHSGAPWPELIAVALTLGLQWRLKHPLLSLLAGTALYVWILN
jgi:branched-subunit amino acid transport protein AzlD